MILPSQLIKQIISSIIAFPSKICPNKPGLLSAAASQTNQRASELTIAISASLDTSVWQPPASAFASCVPAPLFTGSPFGPSGPFLIPLTYNNKLSHSHRGLPKVLVRINICESSNMVLWVRFICRLRKEFLLEIFVDVVQLRRALEDGYQIRTKPERA